MSGLLVARRSGIGTAPDGTKYRIARGKTIADPRHPLVLAYPNDWMPVQVELAVADDEPGDPVAETPEELRGEVSALLARAEAAEVEAGAYRAQLEAVAEVLISHGYAPPAELAPGWLAALVDEAVTEAHPEAGSEDSEPLAEGGPVRGSMPAVGERETEQVEVIAPVDGLSPETVAALKTVAAPAKPRKRAPRATS